MPGVLAVLTGAELAADKIGNLICGWMIHSKDGSPMKMAPHPALAHGKANYVGDAVAVVVAETLAQAKDAAEAIKVDYEVLPAVADPAKAQAQGAPQIHEVAPDNTIYQWHLGDAEGGRRRVQGGQARHQARPRQQPPGAERDRAARRDRRIRRRHRQLHALEHDPESARRAAGHSRLRRHGARAQAARDRARRRRRLRLQDLHLSGGGRLPVGVEEDRPAGEMESPSARRRSSPTRMAAIHVTHAEMAFDADGKITGLRGQDHRQSRRLHVDVLVVGADLSLRARCCPASTTSRRSIARSTRSTPTPCRSTPIAAPAARRRPSWSSG